MITIIDYGLGNLGSILSMLRRTGHQAQVSDRPNLTQLHKLTSLECWQAVHSDNASITTGVYVKPSVAPVFWASKRRRKRDRVYRTSSRKAGLKETVY